MEGVGNRGLKRTPSYFCKMKGVLEMDSGDDNVNVPDATDCALHDQLKQYFDIALGTF